MERPHRERCHRHPLCLARCHRSMIRSDATSIRESSLHGPPREHVLSHPLACAMVPMGISPPLSLGKQPRKMHVCSMGRNCMPWRKESEITG